MSTSSETEMNARPIDVRPMKFTEYRELQEREEGNLFPTLTLGVTQYLHMNDTSCRVLKLSLPATLEDFRDHIFSNVLVYPLRLMSTNAYVTWSVLETSSEIVLWCVYNYPGCDPSSNFFYVNEITVRDEPLHARLFHDAYHYDSRSHLRFEHEKTSSARRWRKTCQHRFSMDESESEQKKNQVLAEVVSREVLRSPNIILHEEIDDKFKLHEL